MSGERYELRIDGPELRRQRELIYRLWRDPQWNAAFSVADMERLDGLAGLLDSIADQAHDRHGVDCLLLPHEAHGECLDP
jgi:hypothetical protein